MAADIVGYSRLIEQDEAATLAAIKGLREQAIDPLLAEHKGRIVKLMGDVRKALGDEAQQLLKTVPKRGYLLAAAVTPAESTAPTGLHRRSPGELPAVPSASRMRPDRSSAA